MKRVAIIDDRIEEELLAYPVLKGFYSFLTDEEQEREVTGHGTKITQLLLDYAEKPQEIEVYNLQILYDADVPVLQDRLTEALLWCETLERMDLIMISLASTDLFGEAQLHDVIQRLTSRETVILAAADNRQFRAVPSCFGEVIGVACDRRGRLKRGECVLLSDDPLGLDLLVNCDPEEGDTSYIPSASYAVPAAAARILGFMDQGIRDKEMLLDAIRVAQRQKKGYLQAYRIPEEFEDQQVRIGFQTGEVLSEEFCIEMAKTCYTQYGYESFLVTASGDGKKKSGEAFVLEDRFLRPWEHSLESFLAHHFESEMVWFIKTEYPGMDMWILEDQGTCRIRCDEGTIRCSKEELLKKMMELLIE